jgi:hypothetical protein
MQNFRVKESLENLRKKGNSLNRNKQIKLPKRSKRKRTKEITRKRGRKRQRKTSREKPC